MTQYALTLSEAELARYQYMAETAAQVEAARWAAAGVDEGAVVVDLGCGPGAVSAVLAGVVGPTGRVLAVDREPSTVEAARATAARAGVDNVTASVGAADDSGLPPGCADVVMIRHVLAHNGGREQAIVDHAASLVRPGGAVYLADTDYMFFRIRPEVLGIEEENARYFEWHSQRGNDLMVGLRLGELLAGAGLEAIERHGHVDVISTPPGFRSPSWAARDALVEAGLATPADVERWAEAWATIDAMDPRPTIFAVVLTAFGRRPSA